MARSPNYPRLTLEDALGKIKEVYTKQHTYSTDKEVVAKNLGYSSINGGSLAMIASLTAYGLLEKDDKGLKVSDDAVTLIELPNDSDEWIQTIQTLAFLPEIFAELRTEFPDKMPQDAIVRHFLIKRKYLSKAADELLRVFRANLEFVNPFISDYNKKSKNTEENSAEKAGIKMQETPEVKRETLIPPPQGDGSQVVVNISASGQISVSFSGTVNEQTFEVLNGIRELQKRFKNEQKETTDLLETETTN